MEKLSIHKIRADGAGPPFVGGSQRKATVSTRDGAYLLKLPTSGAPWVTFNELLGAAIVRLAGGIPCAPSALVDVPLGFRVQDNLGQIVEPGQYFGSLLLTGYRALIPDFAAALSADFAESLYALFAVDVLIYNVDRKLPDVMFEGEEPKAGASVVVDHGNALSGADWTVKRLEERRDCGFDVQDRRLIYCDMTDERQAQKAARRLVALLADRLMPAVEIVCSCYPLNPAYYEAVAAFLQHRGQNLQRLLAWQVRRYAEYLRTD